MKPGCSLEEARIGRLTAELGWGVLDGVKENQGAADETWVLLLDSDDGRRIPPHIGIVDLCRPIGS